MRSKTGEIIPGLRTTKSGKYEARTRDPIKQKTVWLGTFHSVQQASEAYQAKRAQIQAAIVKREKSRPVRKREKQYVETLKAVVDEKTGEKIPGIRTLKSGKYGARVYDPIQRKRVWFGTFDTIEQACKAYQAKKAENKAKRDRCQQSPTKEEDTISDGEEDQSESSCDPEEAVEEIQEKITNDDNVQSEEVVDEIQEEVMCNVQPEESPLPDFILKIIEEFGEKQELFAETKSEKRASEESSSSSRAMEEEEVVRRMQERSISVRDEKYAGGGALGFLIPSNHVFLAVIDNYGNLLGRFSEIDDLSLK